MDDAIGHLCRIGREISEEHLARLSLLQHEHVLMLGTFPSTLPHELAAERLRHTVALQKASAAWTPISNAR